MVDAVDSENCIFKVAEFEIPDQFFIVFWIGVFIYRFFFCEFAVSTKAVEWKLLIEKNCIMDLLKLSVCSIVGKPSELTITFISKSSRGRYSRREFSKKEYNKIIVNWTCQSTCPSINNTVLHQKDVRKVMKSFRICTIDTALEIFNLLQKKNL